MAKTDKLINSRIRTINEADKDLLGGIKIIEKTILDTIISLVESRFNIQGGKIATDPYAFGIINEIAQRIKQDILNSSYSENVDSYLQNFGRLKETTISLSSSLNQINVSRVALTSIEQQAIQKATTALLGNGLDVNLVEPVKNIIFNHVVSGSSIADMELQLRSYIRGNSERLGQLERYTTQIARDSISQYDGTMQSFIQDSFGLNAYGYEGSLIQDSRPQCVRWVEQFNGVLMIEDLKNEIEWAYNYGSGMIQGTTVDTFAINRGGWNCRHIATAIRV